MALTAAQVAQVYALHGVNSELPVGTTVTLGGASGSATLDLNGGNPTNPWPPDNGTYSNGLVTNGATGVAAILTLSPSGGASSTFSGTIQDGAGGVSLVMSGNGTQVLAGASTYAGPARPSAAARCKWAPAPSATTARSPPAASPTTRPWCITWPSAKPPATRSAVAAA